MSKTTIFVPPVGEVIRSVDGKAIMRLQPVIACRQTQNCWVCHIVMNYEQPESEDRIYWLTAQIGFDNVDSRKLKTPNYIRISCLHPFQHFTFMSHEYGQRITFKKGEDGEELELDERSCQIIGYLIYECHRLVVNQN